MYLATFYHCIQQCAGKGDVMPTAKVKKTAGKKTQQCEQCYTVT